jgi:hypothetical protein
MHGFAQRKNALLLLRQRVELLALTSDQLVAFIECKLEQHGIMKVVRTGTRSTTPTAYSPVATRLRRSCGTNGKAKG